MDITEFLTARYDEAAASARRAAAVARGVEWALDIDSVPGSCFLGSEGVRSFAQVGVPFGAHSIAEHIARHDPARVLADIAAKRKLLADLADNVRAWSSDDHTRAAAEMALEAAQRRLAAPYAEHPDYDPAWRIDA